MKERVAIVSGLRTPFGKGGGVIRDLEADELGAFVVTELIARSGISGQLIDELVFGNVLSPPQLANIVRIISVKAGLPVSVPAFTVSRNCASGLESMMMAADKIQMGHHTMMIAAGSESMSNFPVVIPKRYREFLQRLGKAKNWKQKLSILAGFRPGFVIPEIPEISRTPLWTQHGPTAEVLSGNFLRP